MNKEFIPYEQAAALKELGFDEPNYFLKWYDSKGEIREGLGLGEVKAPLYQQAFRWFREKYNIDGFVRIEPLNEKYGFVIYNREKGNFKEFYADYNSVEEAELACLNKIIEIVKQPKKEFEKPFIDFAKQYVEQLKTKKD